MTNKKQLEKLNIINHYYCEDGWYSCPKAKEGCLDESQGDECNCGYEDDINKIEQFINKSIVEVLKDIDIDIYNYATTEDGYRETAILVRALKRKINKYFKLFKIYD